MSTPKPLTQEQVDALVRNAPERHAAILEACKGTPEEERARRVATLEAYNARLAQDAKGSA